MDFAASEVVILPKTDVQQRRDPRSAANMIKQPQKLNINIK